MTETDDSVSIKNRSLWDAQKFGKCNIKFVKNSFEYLYTGYGEMNKLNRQKSYRSGRTNTGWSKPINPNV